MGTELLYLRDATIRSFEATVVDQRDGAGGKRAAVVGRDGPERVARAEDLEDEVLARRQHLEDLHAARRDGIKRIGRHALLEDGLSARVVTDRRHPGHRGPVGGREPAEHRRDLQELVCGRRHER